jgi:adenylate kinase
MKPSLVLLKKQSGRTEYSMKTEVQVVVVDLDKSKQYPLNFVCILPQTAISPSRPSNVFSKVFGASSLEIARRLLHNALKRERDADIRNELTKRLRTLKNDSD